MKPREMRDMTREEILGRQEELQKEIFNLKIRQATKQSDNPLKIRTLRREMARITTILHEDKLGLRPLAASMELKDVKNG